MNQQHRPRSAEELSPTVIRIQQETGQGSVTVYEPYPGVTVSFLDFSMDQVICPEEPGRKLLLLDYCRKGKMTWDTPDQHSVSCGEGDLQLNTRTPGPTCIRFPMQIYQGVTVCWDLDRLEQQPLPELLHTLPALGELREQLCPRGRTRVIRSAPRTEHLFAEFYLHPQRTMDDWCRVKTLELLLFLAELGTEAPEQGYCDKVQAEKVHRMGQFLTDHLAERFTLRELSERFAFPLTSMKRCFKCVYGVPVYTYLRSCRMKQAALLLRTTEQSILEIAGSVGYENPGKFSEAFLAVMGQKPLEYRRERKEPQTCPADPDSKEIENRQARSG